jgi:pyrroloquinoline quinone (PQQ) biosynthesis protein C
MQYLKDALRPEGARVLALEHCVFAINFPRWFGNIIGNCPHLDVRQYMIQNMYLEEVEDPTIKNGHYESMVDFAVALGCDRKYVYNYKGKIHTRMAVSYWDNASRTKPWLEAFAAVGGLEVCNNEAIALRFGGRPMTSRETWAPLGLKKESVTHWEAAEAADTPEGGHGDETLDILVRFADTEEKQNTILATFEESMQVLYYQLDQIGLAAYEASPA